MISPRTLYIPQRDLFHFMKSSEFRTQSAGKNPWLIYRLLPRTGVIMLHGREKLGKTQYTFKLIHSVVTGNEIATLDVIEKGKVLYYNEDGLLPMTVDTYLKRIEEHFFGQEWDFDIMTDLAAALKQCDTDPEYRKKFVERLKQYRMIVVDPIAGLFDDLTFSSNAAEDASALIRHKIRPIQAECDNLWILVHHNNKGTTDQKGNRHSTFAGSVQIRASVDLSLEIIGDKDEAHVIQAHSRYDDTLFPIIITEEGWQFSERQEGELYGPLKGMYSGKLVSTGVLLAYENAKVKCQQLYKEVLTEIEYKFLCKLRTKSRSRKLGTSSLRTWLQNEMGIVYGGSKTVDTKLRGKLTMAWGTITKHLQKLKFIELQTQSFRLMKPGLEVIEGKADD